MERSIMLQIYFGYLWEKCDRLPNRLKEDNVVIIIIVIVTKAREQYDVPEKIPGVCSESNCGPAAEDTSVS